MEARFFGFILILVFLLPGIVCAERLELNITESGKITSYYDEYWVVQVDGNLNIHNPFNNSFDYLKWGYDLGTLTIVEDNATDYLKPWDIYIPYIGPYQTINIGYEIRGISAYDPMWQNHSVLRSAMRDYKANLYTFMVSNIKKSDIENQTIDTSDIKSVANRRLVTVSLENPSDLSQNITSVKVIKTPEGDPNDELETWTFPEDTGQIVVKPHDKWMKDIIDYNSSEGEVYWLSSDVVTDTVPLVIGDQFIRRFTQDDLFNVANASLDEQEYLDNITQYLEHLMYLKKTVSESVLMPGDKVSVDIKINNFAPISRNFNLTESLPTGFKILDAGNGSRKANNSLTWTGKINPDSTRLIHYDLKYTDNVSLGLDFFEPAVVKYENETLYSERIPFIRQYIPDKKIFIQKKLRYSLNNEIVVQLQLQNLGEADIQDLYVKEFLGANDVFSEISVQPESKGMWHIPLLKKNEVWEVTYVTDDNAEVNLLPEVYGVDKKIVLKTLIFENVIKNEWLDPAIQFMEIFAPLFIMGFIIFYFVYRRRVYAKKAHRLSSMEKDIHRLRKETELRPEEKIDQLMKESKSKKDIKMVGGYDIPGHEQYEHQGSGESTRDLAHENLDKLKGIDEDTKEKR